MAVVEDGMETQISEENPAIATQETEEKEEKKELTELEKYWKGVKDNPSDFTGWTYLLQYVEQENDIESGREAFDAFLQRYPYCYGYWKKYADIEKKQGNVDAASTVFEKGLEAIPLSIDLWIHYITFRTTEWENDEDKETKIRELYEKAITAAGTDFLSDKLWDKYIGWEKEVNNLKNITKLYDRLIAIPTQLYSHHFENFSQHVKGNHPKDIVDLDEFLRLRKKVVVEKIDKPDTAETPTEDTDDPSMDAPPGAEIPPPGADLPPGEEAPPGMEVTKVDDEEELKLIRDEIIEIRNVTHKKTEEEVSRRWGYEEGIRRPYFHVKPLERTQLKNWKEYLDFEIENGSHERVVVLFERCMIACALYEEFWIKYSDYLEPHNPDGVRAVFRRACVVHLPKKPSIHLNWAVFEEKQGNFDGALEILENLEKVVPGLAMISVRKINLLRRMRDFKEVKTQYTSYIQNSKDKQLKSFYAVRYARFLSKIMDDYSAAKQVLQEALEEDKANMKLHMQLVDLEFQRKHVDEDGLILVLDAAIQSELSHEQRLTFSRRKMEFLEDFGSEGTRVAEAYNDHQKLLKESQSDKRKAESGDESASKKAKNDPSATNGAGDPQAAANSHDQQQHHHGHHGHMDPHQYNYGHNAWGAYNQGGYGGWGNQGWNYGYGGYGQ